MDISFTPAAENAVKQAKIEADSLGDAFIGTEHILLGLLKVKGSVAYELLRSRGIEHSETSRLIKEMNGGKAVPTSVMLHIPLVEYRDAWNEYLENGMKDTENVKLIRGEVGEKEPYVYCGVHEDNLFESMLKNGSTDSVFCGHDHLNNTILNYKGIDLVYSYSIDYLAYSGIDKQGSQRGCVVLDIASDGTQKITHENYYQDKYVPRYPKEEVTM